MMQPGHFYRLYLRVWNATAGLRRRLQELLREF